MNRLSRRASLALMGLAAPLALARPIDSAPAPRAPSCSRALVQDLQTARDRSDALLAQAPHDESARALSEALEALENIDWARASAPLALEASQQARAFSARVRLAQRQHEETTLLLKQASARARSERDHALLRKAQAAERELATARQTTSVYRDLAQSVSSFSFCALPRGPRPPGSPAPSAPQAAPSGFAEGPRPLPAVH